MSFLFFFLFCLSWQLSFGQVQVSRGSCDATSEASPTFVEWSIDSGLAQVVWADDAGLVLVLSNSGTLYRSANNGVTWTRAALPAELPSQTLRNVWSVDDAPTLLFALAADYTSLLVSSDGGASFVRAGNGTLHAATSPSLARLVAQSGSRGLVLAAIGWTTLCVECDADTAGYHPNLYLSVDTGASWSLVDEYVAPFDVVFSRVGGVGSELLYALLPNQSGSNSACFSDCTLVATLFDHQRGAVLGRAAVFRKVDAMQQISWHGTGQAQSDELVIAVERVDDAGKDRALSLSHDSGRTWLTAVTPLSSAPGEHLDFSVIAADSRVGDIIAVASSAPDARTATLLTSRGPLSSQFVVALQHVRSNSLYGLVSRTDAESSEDLQGVLFANSYVRKDDGSADLTCLQSRVSHSYGSAWSLLRLAPGYCANNSIADADCYLQAYGQVVEDVRIGRIYTTAGGHGVWFAVGHVGRCLDEKRSVEATQMWLSNDAGHTWAPIGPGEQTYEITGLGTRLVVADTGASTNVFRYSLDYGVSFVSCAMAASNFSVTNVITRVVGNDRDSATQNFLFYGTRTVGNGTTSGVLVAALFDRVALRNCTGFEDAGQPASDYVQWMPNAGDGDGCALGQSVVYARKKATADCLVPQRSSPIVSATPCPCTRSDYECDFCHARNASNPTQCVPLTTPACAPRDGVPAGECGIGEPSYVMSSGYRRVPNDVCDAEAQGALTFPVAKPQACPAVRQCSQLACGECATSDQCLWCAQSVSGSVLWATGTCVDVKSSATNFCSQPGVIAAYSSHLCEAPIATPRPTSAPICNSVARDLANSVCAESCGAYNLAVALCPCNATLAVQSSMVCENGCTPAAITSCVKQCLKIGADIIACNCNGQLGALAGEALCKDVNGPDFVAPPTPEPRAVPGDGVFAIMFFIGFIVFLFVIFIAYRLSNRAGRARGYGQA